MHAADKNKIIIAKIESGFSMAFTTINRKRKKGSEEREGPEWAAVEGRARR